MEQIIHVDQNFNMKKYNKTELKQKFGALIVMRRKAMGLSQEELAEKLGMQVRSLSKIENGHTFVTADTLCKFCNVFNLQPKTFFDFNKDKTKVKFNEIIDKIQNSNNEKMDFYYKLINLIDDKLSKNEN